MLTSYPCILLSYIMYRYVVVKFLSRVIFIFPLFLGMVMHTNEVKRKEK